MSGEMDERAAWTPIEVARVGNVGDVLKTSTGGGKSTVPIQPDTGPETINSPPGQEQAS